jgi:hypothetical protein
MDFEVVESEGGDGDSVSEGAAIVDSSWLLKQCARGHDVCERCAGELNEDGQVRPEKCPACSLEIIPPHYRSMYLSRLLGKSEEEVDQEMRERFTDPDPLGQLQRYLGEIE